MGFGNYLDPEESIEVYSNLLKGIAQGTVSTSRWAVSGLFGVASRISQATINKIDESIPADSSLRSAANATYSFGQKTWSYVAQTPDAISYSTEVVKSTTDGLVTTSLGLGVRTVSVVTAPLESTGAAALYIYEKVAAPTVQAARRDAIGAVGTDLATQAGAALPTALMDGAIKAFTENQAAFQAYLEDEEKSAPLRKFCDETLFPLIQTGVKKTALATIEASKEIVKENKQPLLDSAKQTLTEARAYVEAKVHEQAHNFFPEGVPELNKETVIGLAQGLADQAANIASKVGVASTEPLEPDQILDKINVDEVQTRLNAAPVTPLQIDKEVIKLGHNAASFVAMLGVNKLFGCSMTDDELHAIIYNGKTDSKLRDAYFEHLDKAGLFPPFRWLAKLLFYWLLFPLAQKTIQDSTKSMFQNLSTALEGKNKAFNETLSQLLDHENQALTSWIGALETVGKTAGGSNSIEEGLKVELQKPMHFSGLKSKEFFEQITRKLVADFYQKISIGKLFYRQLTGIKLPYPKAWTWCRIPVGKIASIPIFLFNLSIKPLTYPLAFLARVLFYLPDLLLNFILPRVATRVMLKYKVVETLLGRALFGIGNNMGLSQPVLDAMNRSLEEFLVQMHTKENILDPSLQSQLAGKNKTGLENLIRLTLRATNLYNHNTVGDLRKELESKGSVFKPLIDLLDLEKPQIEGTADVVANAIREMTNSTRMKASLFNMVQAINHSFETVSPDPTTRDQMLVASEKRLFDLIQRILSAAIAKRVKLQTKEHLKEEGAADNLVQQIAFRKVFGVVKKMMEMMTSETFLRGQFIRALDKYRTMEIKA